MPTYTTAEAFEEYVEGWTTTNPDALNRLLERAERDVDALLGPRTPRTDTGLKLDPSALRTFERTALSRAVCAQAEYRFRVGEDTLAGGGAPAGSTIKGPDFEVRTEAGASSSGPRIGAAVATELEPIAHLRVLTAGLGRRTGLPTP